MRQVYLIVGVGALAAVAMWLMLSGPEAVTEEGAPVSPEELEYDLYGVD